MTIRLAINGVAHEVAAEPDTPLLYVLRNDLALNAAKFGCGLAQCGACTVLVDGAVARSCVLPIGALSGRAITTLEGASATPTLRALQEAFVAEQAAQCGYCSNGMIMAALDLLERRPHPDETAVRQALDGNLCRCGAHQRVVRAVLRAAGAPGNAATTPADGTAPVAVPSGTAPR